MNQRSGLEVEASRFDVRSCDGTSLAVWVEGVGPPLVLVHGSFRDHTVFGPLVDELRRDVTTFSVDRRGFGASSDAPGYAIEREFEDVAAVVDAVAARTPGPVGLWGHSFGASCAIGGAALSDNVAHLILYEPSLGIAYAAGSIEAVEGAIAAGDVDAAVVAILVGILEMTEDEIDALRATPEWSALLAAGPTVARECKAEDGWVYGAGQFETITATTLLLAGSDSPDGLGEATRQAAAAIPGARVHALEGHGHFAYRTDPAMVADIVLRSIGTRA
ncbi:MAG TPA: alpha/beta hydrolase [Ilumatobacteraceae bacterium]|nr:alpha/beta hydrolase [Ilumatobacteraceae bacterium]